MMNNKRLIVMLLSLVLLKTSTASALNLSQEFGNLASSAGGTSSTVSPSKFRAGAMKGHHLGSASIRLPVKKIDLVRVQRASINAGCHGVDINFGGMSFIRGSEIVEQLKLIAKGAPALIYTMTLNAIAAPLVNALNSLYDAMADLSSSLKNSCEASLALIQVAENTASKIPYAGKAIDTVKGGLSDFSEWNIPATVKSSLSDYAKDTDGVVSAGFEALQSECLMSALSLGLISGMDSQKACGRDDAGSVEDEKDEMASKLSDEWGDEAAKALIKAEYGNTTWNALQLLGVAPNSLDSTSGDAFFPDYRLAVLFQSLIGTTVVTEDPSDEREYATNTIKSDSMSADVFVSILMCGTVENVKNYQPPTATPDIDYKWAVDWCKIKYGIEDDSGADNLTKVINCPNQAASKPWMEGCKDAELVDIATFESNYMNAAERSDKGMLFSTLELLGSAVDKAAKGDGEKFSDKERALIAMSPFPLYEIINVAAATPSMAKALIESNATVLAFHFTSATISSLYDSIAAADGLVGGRMEVVPVKIKDEFFRVQSELQAASAKEVAKLSLYKNTSDIIMHQVKTINGEVLKSTMAMGINGAEFANSMSTMLDN